MSSSVTNILVIRGEPSLLDAFIKENEGPDPVAGEDSSIMHLTFSKSVPLPKKLLKGDFSRLRKWREKNWGAAYVEDTTGDVGWKEGETNRERTLTFWSVNGIPDVWLKKASKLYPEIQFEMSGLDDEMVFFYVYSTKKGKLARREINFDLDSYDQLMEKLEEEPVEFTLDAVKLLFKPSPNSSSNEELTASDYSKLLVMLKWNYPSEEEEF